MQNIGGLDVWENTWISVGRHRNFNGSVKVNSVILRQSFSLDLLVTPIDI